ncbi:adaptive-response sensory-kinase SasA (plasmid) [Comamonadaceae bacterium OS-4]|jgi:two-component system, OmpR family, sensor kinase|nr:adaptive-response sensory-kinase SasA [Comamonadaceae bacterium OS-4]
MDGIQGQLKNSLQFKLSAWLAVVIVGVALAAGVFSFGTAFQEANELQDDQLRQIAALVHKQHLPTTQPADTTETTDLDSESLVVLQVLVDSGAQAPTDSGKYIPFPTSLNDGIQSVTVNEQSWRVVVKTLDDGARIVIGQQTSVRDEIARDSALRTLLPFVILIPILLLLVGELIRQMLKPVKDLAHEVDSRSQEDLRELSEIHIPNEIKPFVTAINSLLRRVEQSMSNQRRFLADAAHELKTPMTALALQAERLEASDMSEQARERLIALKGGLGRSRQLLDQLLSLARAQGATKDPLRDVSVRTIYRRVMEDLMPLAQAKNIDLGMIGERDYAVLATEVDLRILIKNLVDNAIRYTPAGGKIDLTLRNTAGRTILQVEDTGPGIPEEERTRVFDPFYRVLGNDEVGSGLGLSIVQTIALRLGAIIEVAYSDSAKNIGLRVTISFPALPSALSASDP